MPWRGPDYEGEFPSLGWALIELLESALILPDGSPFKFTDEQTSIFVRWYALDEQGRWIYRRGTVRRMKGWGKSPLGGGYAFGELIGDVIFDGWDATGEPVGRPHPAPWVQVAAVSEDQTDNLYVQLYDMLRDSPAIDDHGIDLGLTRIFLKGRPGRIEPVTASAGSREGQPVTGAVLEETHLWTPTSGGKRLAAVIRRNVAKTNGRTLELTNAFSPGERSVAEESHKAFRDGARGTMYDSLEAPPVEALSDRPKLRAALEVARGDSWWVPIDRLVEECNDPATEPADARRFYLNQIVKGSGRAVDPIRWNDLARSEDVEDGARIGLGFDGSLANDATALIGCTADGHLFPIGIWERPPTAGADWRVPREEVNETIRDTFARYSVGMLLCDPPLWHSEIDDWITLYGDEVVMRYPTNSNTRFAPCCDRFSTGIREGSLSHPAHETLTRHVLNMARKYVRVHADLDDARSPYVFVKADTGKIDAGIAAVLAYTAAMTMPAVKPQPQVVFVPL